MIDPHRSRRIEYELLRMVVQCQDHLGYHASLGTLADFFRPNIPDIENRELVDALKRLQPKYLSLCKYVSGGAPCVKYPAEIDNEEIDRKSTRLNSSHLVISYAVFCLKK